MNAVSQTFGSTGGLSQSTANASSTSLRWAALGEAGQVVAMMAGVTPEETSREVRNFAAIMRDSAKWRRDLADRACAELAAVMEPGISALLAINARGANPQPAAQALWGEFSKARQEMLALLPPSGTHGPRRSA
ncbi:hypothetical protein [Aurantiacibacter gangjinensis]|uniref:Uncharacterized protein n=1 Tax=Aurantiacibacter gangjinensis TaxID=502682 RepID=A0A0G9MLA0_9SPHN|nr:hypothetical protein [Aurantiacibacter gangjinensis]APE27434.1 hypothetical protein BMF35_a0605 [Aurantiacibacter gangjinensis]KLE31506.1 hypothetical protein AAW01_08015 [Aurantiacibacter gangjinensis]